MNKKRLFLFWWIMVVCILSNSICFRGNAAEMLTENDTPITINRLYSVYSQTASYRNYLQYNMNCYGYAIHVYSLTGSSNSPYKQQPGEFARDNQTYESLLDEYEDVLDGGSGTEILDFVEGKMSADFASLKTYYGSEWSITTTSASASVPSGYRKIALTVAAGWDYHFYFRHSDGTWSHKPGDGSVTNKSFNTNVVITDNNITTAAAEGGYDDGMRFYLIKKAAVIDYPHYNGHGSSLYTSLCFSDKAGADITKAGTVTGMTQNGRFDYYNDVDYFVFNPPGSGMYTITTSLSSSAYDVDMVIYDTYGNILESDYSIGNPEITIPLSGGSRYFIRIVDACSNVTSYTLFFAD